MKVCGGTVKVTGFIVAQPVQFVVDTGADVTILSLRVYKELSQKGDVEILAPNGALKGLDGKKIEVLGTTTLEFSLGEACSREQVWIADIKEDCS